MIAAAGALLFAAGAGADLTVFVFPAAAGAAFFLLLASFVAATAGAAFFLLLAVHHWLLPLLV